MKKRNVKCGFSFKLSRWVWNGIEKSPKYIKSPPWHCHRNGLFHLEGAFGFQISGAKQEECASLWGKQGCELVKNRKGNAAKFCAPDICQPLLNRECCFHEALGQISAPYLLLCWWIGSRTCICVARLVFKRQVCLVLLTGRLAVLLQCYHSWLDRPSAGLVARDSLTASVPAWGGAIRLLPAWRFLFQPYWFYDSLSFFFSFFFLSRPSFVRWWITNAYPTLCNGCYIFSKSLSGARCWICKQSTFYLLFLLLEAGM